MSFWFVNYSNGVVSIDFSVRINHFHAAWRTRAGRPRGDFGLTTRHTGNFFGFRFPLLRRQAPPSRQFSSFVNYFGCSRTIFPFPFRFMFSIEDTTGRRLGGHTPIGVLSPLAGFRLFLKKGRKNISMNSANFLWSSDEIYKFCRITKQFRKWHRTLRFR